MSPKYDVALAKTPQDLADWDRFVDDTAQGSIFCYSWWLEAVCPGQSAILILRKGDQIVAGLPMMLVQRWGQNHVQMPRLSQTLGPLIAPSRKQSYQARLSEEMSLLGELVDAIPRFATFRMRFHHAFTNWLPFYWAGYQQTTRYTYRLDNLDKDTLWAGLDPHTRSHIRNAEKHGLIIKTSDSVEEVWEITCKTFKRQGVSVPITKQYLDRIAKACRGRNSAKAIYALDSDGRLHSAAYIVWDTRSTYYLLSGADPELRGSDASSLVLWEAIQWSANNTPAFDCEGSMMPSVEPFFRSFGAVQTPYFEISKDNRSLALKAGMALRGFVGRSIARTRSRRQ